VNNEEWRLVEESDGAYQDAIARERMAHFATAWQGIGLGMMLVGAGQLAFAAFTSSEHQQAFDRAAKELRDELNAIPSDPPRCRGPGGERMRPGDWSVVFDDDETTPVIDSLWYWSGQRWVEFRRKSQMTKVMKAPLVRVVYTPAMQVVGDETVVCMVVRGDSVRSLRWYDAAPTEAK
jgi:hypothetical protein